MSLLLSVETSTGVCSVALNESGKPVIDREIRIPQSHASKLAPLIEEVMHTSGRKMKEIAAVAITSGPGSYTGLRIGTSMAKALCYSLNVPLISVGTLDVMAYQVNKANSDRSFLCPMIDARRMEVYCQVVDADLSVRQSVEAKIIDTESFLEFLTIKKTIFFGDGAWKCRDVIQHENAFFMEDVFPSASALGEMAYLKFQAKKFEDVVRVEPFYLKDFLIRKPV